MFPINTVSGVIVTCSLLMDDELFAGTSENAAEPPLRLAQPAHANALTTRAANKIRIRSSRIPPSLQVNSQVTLAKAERRVTRGLRLNYRTSSQALPKELSRCNLPRNLPLAPSCHQHHNPTTCSRSQFFAQRSCS